MTVTRPFSHTIVRTLGSSTQKSLIIQEDPAVPQPSIVNGLAEHWNQPPRWKSSDSQGPALKDVEIIRTE
jgi:hypothetical protein